VVIIIIGILAAIALPAFLNQANRARQSEATTYIGSINRGQQAYRLESPTFADKIDLLGLGIQTTTEFYTYGSGGTTVTANTLAFIPSGTTLGKSAYVQAAPKDSALLGYTGAAYTLQDSGGNSTTTALLCIGGAPGTAPTVTLANEGLAGATLTATGAKSSTCK
jgi:type IV pilus assembly protein PilA